MPFICVGEEVRMFDPDGGCYPGTVVIVEGTRVVVDFADWREQWDDADVDFTIHHVFLECREVLMPIRRGTIVKSYRS